MLNDSYFSFTDYSAKITEGTIRFNYELAHKGNVLQFSEILEFDPVPGYKKSEESDPTLIAILDSLHILSGISYWKTSCPSEIRMESQQLAEKQAIFWNTVYTKGLGEFFYKNKIDFRSLIHFPHTLKSSKKLADKKRSNRSLVLLGSGKDSIVTSELLKKHNKPFSLFTLNARPIHRQTAERIGKDLITIKRILDPKLFELNKKPGIFNGHIPITSITSLVGLFAAYLYDYRYVVLSNEESANYGNVEYLGSQVNHQWSKTFEFETLFRDYIRNFVTRDITYFSLLRPLTELNIVKLFIELPQYFQIFSSCNKNFGIIREDPSSLWCGECPKCAFVFLLLAAFLPKSDVVSIFHQNLLNKDELLGTFKELLGIEGVKPFECVGTPEEVLAAFASVIEHGEYEEDMILRSLAFAITDKLKDKKVIFDRVLTLSRNHHVPPAFRDILKRV